MEKHIKLSELGQKVLIKPLNRVGFVTRYTSTFSKTDMAINTSYEVSYEDNYAYDYEFGIGEYLQRRGTWEGPIEELELVKEESPKTDLQTQQTFWGRSFETIYQELMALMCKSFQLSPEDLSLDKRSSNTSVQEKDIVDSLRYALYTSSGHTSNKILTNNGDGLIKWDPAHTAITSNQPKIPKECNHQWKTYEGFTSCFDYCEKCDVKR